MTQHYTTVVVDDLRNFRTPRPVLMLRNSADALVWFEEHKGDSVDELWLDHDLGMTPDGIADTTMPVVDWLCEQAFNDAPVDIGQIWIHTSNPVGARTIAAVLERYGYRAQKVQASIHFVV